MPTYRSLRMAEAIREVVATAILSEVADPRVHSVTVLGVEVSADLRQASVYVSIMGAEHERNRALQGLKRATGFLQRRVAARLQTRFTPVLSFKHDERVKKAAEITRLIDEAVSSDQRPRTVAGQSVAEVAASVDSASSHTAGGAASETS
jgi:ribosome-binding factor A